MIGRRKGVAAIMCIAGLGGMLFDLGGTIINPAIPYLESLKAFTTAELSHLTSAVVLSAAFAGLVAGTLADRLGRRRTMLIAAAIAFVACLPICLGGGYWLFFLAAFALVYFLVAAFVLPETKGKTLEEIESLFKG